MKKPQREKTANEGQLRVEQAAHHTGQRTDIHHWQPPYGVGQLAAERARHSGRDGEKRDNQTFVLAAAHAFEISRQLRYHHIETGGKQRVGEAKQEKRGGVEAEGSGVFRHGD